jgi:hypothetical protein
VPANKKKMSFFIVKHHLTVKDFIIGYDQREKLQKLVNQHKQSITKLTLDTCWIHVDQEEYFENFLKNLSNLTELKMISNVNGVMLLFDELKSLKLKMLRLDFGNCLIHIGFLCEILETNKNIEGLSLNGPFDFSETLENDENEEMAYQRLRNAICSSNIQKLIFDEYLDYLFCSIFTVSQVLKENLHLTSFEFPVLSSIGVDDQYFTEGEWTSFCNGIRFHPCLSELKLSFYINDDPNQTQLLFHSIANNQNIKSFSFNDSVNESVKNIDDLLPSIALMSSHLKTLKLLNVTFNDVEVWETIMTENTSLISLDLSIYQNEEHDDSECRQFNQIVDTFQRNGSIISGRVTNGFYTAANLFERNFKNLEKTKSACQTILAIKKFRKSPMLQMYDRNITLMMAQYLKKTTADYESWETIK